MKTFRGQGLWPRLLDYLAIGPDTTGHTDKLVASLGGVIAGALTITLSGWVAGAYQSTLVIASMGASAVLLFAAPHGAFSQPWPLVLGHLASAAIGVTCQQLIPQPLLAASLAVGLAIAAMQYLRCLHPPGGATALIAVIGGPGVHSLGYQFVLTPVLLNVLIMLVAAAAFNAMIGRRRSVVAQTDKASAPDAQLAHGDLVYALREIGSFIDVTEEDLSRIYSLAQEHSRRNRLSPDAIRVGGCYSNGRYDGAWSIRLLLWVGAGGTVGYRVVGGEGEGTEGGCTQEEFARWAHYEVMPMDGSWVRVRSLDTPQPEAA